MELSSAPDPAPAHSVSTRGLSSGVQSAGRLAVRSYVNSGCRRTLTLTLTLALALALALALTLSRCLPVHATVVYVRCTP